MQIQINTEKCKKDKICIIECPFNILRENSDGFPEVIPEAKDLCMRCGHCLAVCPSDALTFDGVAPESCEPALKEVAVDVPAMEALLKNRRSVRVYKSKPVEREKVTHLMDMLRWAPTAKNLQPVHWVLVDDRDKIHELAKMTVQWLNRNNAYPGIVAAWETGEDMILRSAPLIAIAHTATDALIPVADCSIAVTSLELAATSYGIGSFWAGFFMMAASRHPPIAQYLNLPESHAVYAALALGYPKFKYHHIPERREAKVTWL